MTDTPPAVPLLRQWLDLTDTTQSGLAASLACSTALVEAWMSGRRRPSFEKAAALETLTGRTVPIRSWAYPEKIPTVGIDGGR